MAHSPPSSPPPDVYQPSPLPPALRGLPPPLPEGFDEERMIEAEGGDAEAQFELARACLHDPDIPHHSEWAASWYEQAGGQDHVEAQYEVAGMYLVGNGVHKREGVFSRIRFVH